MNARIQIYPSVMLAMPDSNINKAYEETSELLQKYVSSDEEEDSDD